MSRHAQPAPLCAQPAQAAWGTGRLCPGCALHGNNIRTNDPHQRQCSTFQWRAILPSAIALSLWLLHASGTVCLPTLLRPRHCWLSDGCWRQSCSVAVNLCFCTVGLHSNIVWITTLTNFVRCPCSRFWLYATLIFSFIIIIIIIITWHCAV